MLKYTLVALALASTPVFAAAVTAPAAAPAAAAKPVASLDAVHNVYKASSTIVERNIPVIMQQGPACGMIGGMFASNLQQENALGLQRRSAKRIADAIEAANKDEKKKAAAKKVVEEEIANLKIVNKKVADNLDNINMGLSGNDAPCVASRNAFNSMRATSGKMMKSLETVRDLLSGKRASMEGLEDSATQLSHAELHDQAQERADAQREESIQSAALETDTAIL